VRFLPDHFAPQAEPAPAVPARAALRAATAQAHARLDRLYSAFDLGAPDGYADFLLAHAPAFLAVEQALDAAGAETLAELGIPFLFATGYGEQAQLPPDHRGRMVVQKPYTLENVARAMDALVGGGAGGGGG
jgi:hypothetical protein